MTMFEETGIGTLRTRLTIGGIVLLLARIVGNQHQRSIVLTGPTPFRRIDCVVEPENDRMAVSSTRRCLLLVRGRGYRTQIVVACRSSRLNVCATDEIDRLLVTFSFLVPASS